jgi:hypothetical protein
MENHKSELEHYISNNSSFSLEKIPVEIFHADFIKKNDPGMNDTNIVIDAEVSYNHPRYRIVQPLPEIHFMPITRFIKHS